MPKVSGSPSWTFLFSPGQLLVFIVTPPCRRRRRRLMAEPKWCSAPLKVDPWHDDDYRLPPVDAERAVDVYGLVARFNFLIWPHAKHIHPSAPPHNWIASEMQFKSSYRPQVTLQFPSQNVVLCPWLILGLIYKEMVKLTHERNANKWTKSTAELDILNESWLICRCVSCVPRLPIAETIWGNGNWAKTDQHGSN